MTAELNVLPGRTYPEQYDSLLQEKHERLRNILSRVTDVEIDVHPSQEQAYRLRAEFRIWHENNRAHYAMMSPGKDKTALLIDNYSPGSQLIQSLMPVLLDQLNEDTILKKQLFQLEFLTSLKGEALITLIYHRVLDETWVEHSRILKQKLLQLAPNIHIVGRSRGQKIAVAQDFIYEQFRVAGSNYTYQQIEGGFTQPNGYMNEKMLGWADSACKNIGGDLLELYCGNGNFTLPLSKNYNRVLATEVSKTSINAALHNIALNQINNIDVARLSSEEASQALNRTRPFKRLANINLDQYNFSTVFVDPPRAGIDCLTLGLVKKFDNICYISCNPDTLIDNLDVLSKTHTVKKSALFDQFPYTHHIECGVLLTRNNTKSTA